MATTKAMKVTTLRFGRDLWALLEHEAAVDGVSVAQYIREAALARAVAGAASRGEATFGAGDLPAGQAAGGATTPRSEAEAARLRAIDTSEDARALRAESEQAVNAARQRHASLAQRLRTRPPA